MLMIMVVNDTVKNNRNSYNA